MYWSQTESSKCSPSFQFNHLGQPRTVWVAPCAGMLKVLSGWRQSPLQWSRCALRTSSEPLRDQQQAAVRPYEAGSKSSDSLRSPPRYAGIGFGSYEALKGALGRFAGVEESELKPWKRVTAGAVAGACSRRPFYPLAGTQPLHGVHGLNQTQQWPG